MTESVKITECMIGGEVLKVVNSAAECYIGVETNLKLNKKLGECHRHLMHELVHEFVHLLI